MQLGNQDFVFLYLCYGRAEVFYQAIFSLLTLYRQLGDEANSYKILIYTDDRAPFDNYLNGFPYEVQVLTKQTLKDWKGPFGFNHRTKICVLNDCFQKYKCNILFVDTDTIFLKPPSEIIGKVVEGVTVMNKNEFDLYEAGNYEDVNWVILRKLVRDNKFDLRGKTFSIPFSVRMWNSGVIGINRQYAHLMQDALSLCDQFYGHARFFLAEQFALSYIFQTNTQLIASEEHIFHYWPYKSLFNPHVKIFLAKNKNARWDVMTNKLDTFVKEWLKMSPIDPPFYKEAYFRMKMSLKILFTGS